MFTSDLELSKELIAEAIQYNDNQKGRYDKLDRYYKGEHDIKTDPTWGKNRRIVVNHAKYITDTNVGYLLGNNVEYQVREEANPEIIEPILEEYREQHIGRTDNELCMGLSIFGRYYELEYLDGNDVRTALVDPRNAICIYDTSVKHEKRFAMVYEHSDDVTKKVVNITIYDEFNKYTYNEGVIGEPEPHNFGKIPVVEYKNNKDCKGDFEGVIGLIDAYNMLQSIRIHDKEQLIDAILVAYGMDLDNADIEQLKKYRTLSRVPSDARLEYLVKALNERDTDVLRQVFEQDIHKISMTPNMSDEEFAGNVSGVALKYKLLSFEQNIANKERYLEDGLLERMGVYASYDILGASGFEEKFVDVVFKRNLPRNDLETSSMINNLRGLVSHETLISQLSFVQDASEEIETIESAKDEQGFGEDVVGDIDRGLENTVQTRKTSILEKLGNIFNQ